MSGDKPTGKTVFIVTGACGDQLLGDEHELRDWLNKTSQDQPQPQSELWGRQVEKPKVWTATDNHK